MAITVGTQIVKESPRLYVAKFRGYSDGTGESVVKKVDFATLTGSPSDLKLLKVEWQCNGLQVRIFWEATASQTICTCTGNGRFDFTNIGGLPNNGGAGKTGSILFTTEAMPGVALAAAATYTIMLYLKKV